jgi:hypothetical protein
MSSGETPDTGPLLPQQMVDDECKAPITTADSSTAMAANITVFHHGIARDLLFIGGMMV